MLRTRAYRLRLDARAAGGEPASGSRRQNRILRAMRYALNRDGASRPTVRPRPGSSRWKRSVGPGRCRRYMPRGGSPGRQNCLDRHATHGRSAPATGPRIGSCDHANCSRFGRRMRSDSKFLCLARCRTSPTLDAAWLGFCIGSGFCDAARGAASCVNPDLACPCGVEAD
jgi:hypothetical protein